MAAAMKVLFFVLLVVLVKVEGKFFKKKIEFKVEERPEVTEPPKIDPRTTGLLGFFKGMNLYRKYYLFSHSLEFLGGRWNALLNIEVNHPIPVHSSYYAEFLSNSHNLQNQPGLIHGHVDREGSVPIFQDEKKNLTRAVNDTENSLSMARFLKPHRSSKRIARELPVTEMFSKLDDSFRLENETNAASNSTSTTTKHPDTSTTLITEATTITTHATPNSTYGPPPLPELTTSKPWNHNPAPYPNPTCGYHYGKPQVKDVDAITFTTNDYNGGRRYGTHNTWQGHHYENWGNHFRPSVPDMYRNMWDYHGSYYIPYPHPIRSSFGRRRRHFE